jgi:hypothetical protein
MAEWLKMKALSSSPSTTKKKKKKNKEIALEMGLRVVGHGPVKEVEGMYQPRRENDMGPS